MHKKSPGLGIMALELEQLNKDYQQKIIKSSPQNSVENTENWVFAFEIKKNI